jgi:hypothetical protein
MGDVIDEPGQDVIEQSNSDMAEAAEALLDAAKYSEAEPDFPSLPQAPGEVYTKYTSTVVYDPAVLYQYVIAMTLPKAQLVIKGGDISKCDVTNEVTVLGDYVTQQDVDVLLAKGVNCIHVTNESLAGPRVAVYKPCDVLDHIVLEQNYAARMCVRTYVLAAEFPDIDMNDEIKEESKYFMRGLHFKGPYAEIEHIFNVPHLQACSRVDELISEGKMLTYVANLLYSGGSLGQIDIGGKSYKLIHHPSIFPVVSDNAALYFDYSWGWKVTLVDPDIHKGTDDPLSAELGWAADVQEGLARSTNISPALKQKIIGIISAI